VRVVIESDPRAAAGFAARWVADRIERSPASVLALAAGSTMVPVYAALVEQCAGGSSFARCRAFDLDEYAGLAASDPRSLRHFVRTHLTGKIGLPDAAHCAPDGLAADLEAECARYEAAIEAAGGLDLAVLGLGRNGHLAFNEPGGSLASRTRIEMLMRVELSGDPHRDALPRVAITMGIGTILSARACLVVAFGAEKERAVAEMIEGPLTSLVPASALQLHPNTTVVLDDAAAALLVNAAHYREAEALRREMDGAG
jgi:glucosamine-6-phosphate deaminase